MPISSFFFNLRCALSSRTYSIHHVMHALERYASSTGPDKASIDPPVRPSIWTVSFAFFLAPHQIPPRNDVDARPERWTNARGHASNTSSDPRRLARDPRRRHRYDGYAERNAAKEIGGSESGVSGPRRSTRSIRVAINLLPRWLRS